jgi:hypothetical protein
MKDDVRISATDAAKHVEDVVKAAQPGHPGPQECYLCGSNEPVCIVTTAIGRAGSPDMFGKRVALCEPCGGPGHIERVQAKLRTEQSEGN